MGREKKRSKGGRRGRPSAPEQSVTVLVGRPDLPGGDDSLLVSEAGTDGDM